MDFFKDIKPLTKTSSNSLSKKEESNFESEKNFVYDPIIEKEKTGNFVPLKNINLDSISNSNTNYKGIWVFAILAILVLFFVLSLRFSRANILIELKPNVVSISEKVSLNKGSSEPFSFEIVQIPADLSKDILLDKEEKKNEKAKGKITIYNNSTNTPQTLVSQTRFETSEGLIFRVTEKVSVPGYEFIDNKKVPGMIDVLVVADETGEKYNISENINLTIPGFKGTEKFDNLYGKTTSNFTGGLSGTYYTLGNKENIFSEDEKNNLKNKLNEMIRQQIPEENYVYLNDLNILNINVNDSGLFSKDQNSQVKIEGTLTQVVFNKKEFINYLSKKSEFIKSGSITKFDSLSVKILTNLNNEKLEDIKILDVELNGSVLVYNKPDDKLLKEEFLGLDKNDFNLKIKENFENLVNNAELEVAPFWIRKIPNNFNRINIKYKDVR
jgi:hypothetical protein